ncbi:hypothetical protein B0H11DRAFT_2343310 [Mycena galericulata]|nr:hypothetical protein B0H11DRAFT_2343310 [Mycena galericulata]
MSMSRYLDGDDARENPLPLQALQREGSDGGEHGSGAFDVVRSVKFLWPGSCRAEGQEGGKEIANATSESNVEQVPRLRVTAQRNRQSTISEDEHDDVQREKEGQTLRTGDEASGPRRLRSRGANVSFTTSTSDTAPSAAKHKSALTAAAPAPKPKRRKAGDPLAGRAIELVPGDKTTAVSPREYAQKEPEEFAARYPQYFKFL